MVLGNQSYVNRNNNLIGNISTFIVNVTDVTRNSIPLNDTNGTVWVTNDTSTYQSYFVQTNSSGYFNFDFNPNCSGPHYDAGLQYWLMGVNNDYCYNPENSTNDNYTVYINGSLILSIVSPNGTKFLRGEHDIPLKGNISDECGDTITTAIVNFTSIQNGVEHLCTNTYNQGNGFYNCTITDTSSWSTSNLTAQYGYAVKINATANQQNENS